MTSLLTEMKTKPDSNLDVKRRRFLPILGTGILLTIFPVRLRASKKEEKMEYKTLLKPDGTAVQVTTKGIKKAKVVRKNISNRELLSWLKKPSGS